MAPGRGLAPSLSEPHAFRHFFARRAVGNVFYAIPSR
jgi:hypothetical protein